MKPAQKGTQKSVKSITATSKKFKGFTDEERGAMKERFQELKGDKEDGESTVLAKIAEGFPLRSFAAILCALGDLVYPKLVSWPPSGQIFIAQMREGIV